MKPLKQISKSGIQTPEIQKEANSFYPLAQVTGEGNSNLHAIAPPDADHQPVKVRQSAIQEEAIMGVLGGSE